MLPNPTYGRYALALSFFFLFFSWNLSAQVYDLSNYRARWERRPALTFEPNLGWNHAFTNEATPSLGAGLGMQLNWQESSNMDEQIRTINTSVNTGFSYFRPRGGNSIPIRTQSWFSGSGQYQLDKYLDDKRFWGVGLSGSLNLILLEEEGDGAALRDIRINVAPEIFAGIGRIEFAEDALLARWMLEDLQEAGVINSFGASEVVALAQRVTSIIGNRTFDFRRRRIFELQQLRNVFEENGLESSDDFMLFAVLNDNWAFANRAALPHGQRFRFGLRTENSYTFREPQAEDVFTLRLQPYLEYQRAAISKGQNGASIFRANVTPFYWQPIGADDNIFAIKSEYGLDVQLEYEMIWLPNSRTRISWENNVVDRFSRRQFEFQENLESNLLLLNSTLRAQYFIDYNWTLTLQARLTSTFSWDGFDQVNGSSLLSLSSQYFFF